MKVLFKILMAPVTLVLTLFVWICSAILYCSSFVFGLAGTLIGLLGLLVLISGNVQNAVILFVLAFVASPMGLPMAAAWMIGKVQDLRCAVLSCLGKRGLAMNVLRVIIFSIITFFVGLLMGRHDREQNK